MAQIIEVDPPALLELAGRLSMVKAELEKAQCVFNDDGSIHSSKIDGALEHFCGAWSDKRGELVIHLQGAGDFLRNCAEQFASRDKELEGALGAPPSESNGRPADSSGNSASGNGAGQGGPPVSTAGPVPSDAGTPPGVQAPGYSEMPGHHAPIPVVPVVGAIPPTNGSQPSGSQPPVQTTPALPKPPEGAEYDFADGPSNEPTERGFRSGRPEDFAAWSLNEMLHEQDAEWTFDNYMTTQVAGNEAGYGKWGAAHHWLDRAEELGFPHDDTPKTGAIAYWGKEYGDGEGNVAVVKDLNEDGSITVESLNRRSGPLLRTLQAGSRRWPEAFIHIVPGS